MDKITKSVVGKGEPTPDPAPMTDKTIGEEIAEGNPYPKHQEGWFGGARHEEIEHYALRKGFEQGAAFVLAIPEIKEGQELREKVKSGKLVELHRNQSWPKNPHGFTDRQMRLHFYECHDQCHSAEQEAAEAAGFRRVVKG